MYININRECARAFYGCRILSLAPGQSGLEYGWHEDEAVGVALTELLLSVLQVVTQPVMLGCVTGVGGGLACPWLVAVATWVGDGDIKHHVGAHVLEVTDDDVWYVPCFHIRR
jgi:hypothetical protein